MTIMDECKYCNKSIDFKIKEAYNDISDLKTSIYIDSMDNKDNKLVYFLSIRQNIDTDETDGYYCDILFCPFCGREF